VETRPRMFCSDCGWATDQPRCKKRPDLCNECFAKAEWAAKENDGRHPIQQPHPAAWTGENGDW
jgi:hypothetical protein